VVLSEEAIFAYKVDNYYSPECDRGLAFNDAAIGIDWQLTTEQLILSDKDTTQPLLKNADCFNFEVNLYD
jgi:dTDP-4-dehydrorhamnose 3,5-epimerase